MSVTDEVNITSARQELLCQREELLRTLAQCRSDADGDRPDSPDGIGETEHLSHAEQVEMSGRVAALTEEALSGVESALERIESGTYGTCAGCGEPIGAARLLAIPSAEFCIDCQGSHETRIRVTGDP